MGVMDPGMEVFDRRAVRRHRDRAAPNIGSVADVLRDCADRLLDRLDDISIRFSHALDVGIKANLLVGLWGKLLQATQRAGHRHDWLPGRWWRGRPQEVHSPRPQGNRAQVRIIEGLGNRPGGRDRLHSGHSRRARRTCSGQVG